MSTWHAQGCFKKKNFATAATHDDHENKPVDEVFEFAWNLEKHEVVGLVVLLLEFSTWQNQLQKCSTAAFMITTKKKHN